MCYQGLNLKSLQSVGWGLNEGIIMIELRLYKEKAGQYFDGILHESTCYKDAILQYRTMTNIQEIGLQEPIWSEWVDVPEVYA